MYKITELFLFNTNYAGTTTANGKMSPHRYNSHQQKQR